MESWRAKGDEALEAENFEEALQAYERALFDDPDDHESAFNRVVALARLDRYDDALAALQPLTKNAETAARAWGTAAGLHHSVQNFEEEARALHEGQQLISDPDDFVWVGEAFDEIGRHNEAIDAFDRAVSGYDSAGDEPSAARAVMNKALSLLNGGHPRQAIAAFRSRPPPEDAQGAWHLLLARAYNETDDPANALQIIDEATPDVLAEVQAGVCFQRAIALNSLGRFEDALSCLIEAESLPLDEAQAENFLLEKAKALAALGRHSEVLEVLEKPVDDVAERLQWQWRFSTASALNEVGRFGEALETIDFEPWPSDDDARGWLLLVRASALSGTGSHQDALAAADEAESLLGNEAAPNVALARATALNSLGRPGEVLDALPESPERAGVVDGLLWFHKGMALNRLGRNDEALAPLEVAAGLLPAGPLQEVVALHRAWAHVSLGRPADALAALPKPLPQETTEQGALWLLQARTFNQLERHEDALASLDVAARLMDPTVGVLTERAISLSKTGKPEEALEDLEAAAGIDPSIDRNVDYLRLRLNLLVVAGRTADTEAVLDKLAGLDPETRPLWLALKASSMLTGPDVGRGLALAAEVAADPDDAASASALAWVGTALARTAIGDSALAEAGLVKAVELDPSAAEVPFFGLVAAMNAVRLKGTSALGMSTDEAIEILARFERDAKGSFAATLAGLRGLAHLKAGRNEDALQAFDEALARAGQDSAGISTSVLSWTQKGTLALNARRMDEADEAFARAVEMTDLLPEHHPGRVAAILGDGTRLLVRHDLAKVKNQGAALADADRALTRISGARLLAEALPIAELHATARLLEAIALKALERPEEALAVLRRAEEEDPDHVDVLLLAGAVCLELEDYESSLAEFQRATKVAVTTDDRCSAALGEGDAQAALGSYEFAVGSYRRAVSLCPEWPGVWRSLGALYEDMERHEAARLAFRRAWQLSKGSPGAIEAAIGLSASLIGAGRHAEALTFLDHDASPRDSKRKPSDPRLAFNRAVALLKKGDQNAAGKAFEEAARGGLEAAEEPARALRHQGDGGRSWVEFWFGSSQSSWRKAAGGLLAFLLFGLLAVLFVEPGSLPGMDWLRVSGDWPRAVAPLVVVALLLVLPSLERFSFGRLEVETRPWQPESAGVPLPSVDDLVRLVRTVAVSKGTVTPGPVAASAGAELLPPPPPLLDM